MRPLLAAAVTVLAAAGCGLVQPPRAAVETPPAAPETLPVEETPPPAITRTRAEVAYLKALDAALGKELGDGESLDEDAYLEDGREACELVADEKPVRAVMAVQEVLFVSGSRDIYKAALTKLCPKHKQVWGWVATGFGDGEYTVGKDIRAGTYRTMARPLTDCYWERSTSAGAIIDNQLVTNAPAGVTVTVRAGEGFTARDCGPWIRA